MSTTPRSAPDRERHLGRNCQSRAVVAQGADHRLRELRVAGTAACGRGRRHASAPGSLPASRGSRTLAGGSAEIQRSTRPCSIRPTVARDTRAERATSTWRFRWRTRTARTAIPNRWSSIDSILGRGPYRALTASSSPDGPDGSPPVVTRSEPWAASRAGQDATAGHSCVGTGRMAAGFGSRRPPRAPTDGHLAEIVAREPTPGVPATQPHTAHPFDMAHCARPVHKPRDAVDNRPARGGPPATERGRTAPERGPSVEMPKPPHLAGRHPNEPLHLVFFA